jgi:hypothetical protein
VSYVATHRDILDHDVWRHQGLGKGAQSTYACLGRDGPATGTELRERTGYSRGTIWRHVRRLQNQGLVTGDHDGRHHVVEGVDFDALAVDLEVAGTGERQRVKHQQQRDLYVQYLEEPDSFCIAAWLEWSPHRKQRHIDRINRQRALLLAQLGWPSESTGDAEEL